jgi:FkbM family methyltransferase
VRLFQELIDAVKRRVRRRIVRRRYGTDRPAMIQLPGSARRLYINPQDARAHQMLVVAPLLGRIPRNQPFWKSACAALTPTLALDIGMNFGECLFAGDYASHTELHGFEANPRLQPFVRRSLREHPARERMHLHFGIVDRKPATAGRFFIHRDWSGSSTALRGLVADEPEQYDPVEVPVLSVDSALMGRRSTRPGGTLVFKIDVEGFEFQVLKGMERTLAAPACAVGLIEFDREILDRSRDSARGFWKFLRDRFQIYAFSNGDRAQLVEKWSDLQSFTGQRGFRHDLLLVSGDDERLGAFLNEWTTAPATVSRRRAA